MGKKSVLLFLLLTALLVSSPSFADSYTLTITGTGANNLAGVYVAPYYGKLTDTTTSTSVSISMICDDWLHDVFPPSEVWPVAITNLGTAVATNNFSSTYFGSSTDSYNATTNQTSSTGGTASQNYQEAAYLAYLIDQPGATSSQIADANFAIWAIMNTNTAYNLSHLPWNGTLSASDISAIDGDITAAQANYGTLSAGFLNDVRILTPTNVGAPQGTWPQEYITVVPEPGTLVLFASGAFGLIARRRRSEQ